MHNAKRRFDVVVCDIDGCLTPESHAAFNVGGLAHIAEHNRRAYEREDRPLVTLCSGRPEPFVEAICRTIGNITVPAIAENGVWLYLSDRNGWERDPTITAEHLRAVHEAREWVESELGPKGVTMQPGKTASISLYHQDTEILRGLEPRVREVFEHNAWPLRVSMTWLYINCDLKHVNKGTAMERLARAIGVDRERMAGIGDTDGDAFIADRVAFFACPANASPGIKRRAHYLSPQPELEGVLDILQQVSDQRASPAQEKEPRREPGPCG